MSDWTQTCERGEERHEDRCHEQHQEDRCHEDRDVHRCDEQRADDCDRSCPSHHEEATIKMDADIQLCL